MKKNIKIFCLLFIILSSCIDLQHVNTFSETSLKLLETVSAKSSSFTNLYLNYNADIGIKLLHVKDEELKNNRFGFDKISIDSTQYRLFNKADKTISYFVNTVSAYFQGISKISSKGLVNYDFDKVAAGLKSEDIQSFLGISSDQIDAGSKIAKTFADEILGKYRDKKLRQILTEKDAALSESIDALATALKSLQGAIKNSQINLSANYVAISVRPELNADAKIEWRTSVVNELAFLTGESTKIDFLIDGLKKIEEGHHKIVAEVQNSSLDAEQIKALLDEYSTKIFETFTEIKSLKNK